MEIINIKFQIYFVLKKISLFYKNSFINLIFAFIKYDIEYNYSYIK
jgi:hypothetical protein